MIYQHESRQCIFKLYISMALLMTQRKSGEKREGRFRGQQLVAHQSTAMLSFFFCNVLSSLRVSISFIARIA